MGLCYYWEGKPFYLNLVVRLAIIKNIFTEEITQSTEKSFFIAVQNHLNSFLNLIYTIHAEICFPTLLFIILVWLFWGCLGLKLLLSSKIHLYRFFSTWSKRRTNYDWGKCLFLFKILCKIWFGEWASFCKVKIGWKLSAVNIDFAWSCWERSFEIVAVLSRCAYCLQLKLKLSYWARLFSILICRLRGQICISIILGYRRPLTL